MVRVYTKLGDDGSTGLLFGGRVSKADSLIEVVGSVDEAVATLGMARATVEDEDLSAAILRIQRDLFVVAADLATDPRSRDRLEPGVSLVTAGMVTAVEARIDREVEARPLRPVFIVPGENFASAALDQARTFVRRAERRLVEHQERRKAPETVNPAVGHHLNRVSDLLYVLARRAAGTAEEPLSH